MKNMVPAAAALMSTGMIVDKVIYDPDWQIIPWTLMFGFWMLVWYMPKQQPKKGSVAHNTLPNIRKNDGRSGFR